MIKRTSIVSMVLQGFYTATSFNEFSRIMGRIAGLHLPGPLMRAVIDAYCRYFNVDLSDVKVEDWKSLNDFFTRHLLPGARPVDLSTDTMVSPADGTIQSLGMVKEDTALQVKGISYRVSELLGNRQDAKKFDNGFFYTVYLSPADYHRVHSPVDGSIVSARYIPGRLFSVNPRVGKYCDNFLVRNERVVITIDTDVFGKVVVVMVGAAGVGSIEVFGFPEIVTDNGKKTEFFMRKSPINIKKGQEIGVFNMGSTVVVFATANTEYIGNTIGKPVRYGEVFLRILQEV